MRSIPLLAIALVGCGSPTANLPDAGPTADLASPPPDDLGPSPTVLRVHYPAGAHTLAVRGSAGPLDWSRGLPMTAGADDTWTFSSTAIAAPTEWKPLLDDATWSRGPNYTVAPGATVDVWPHFTATNGRVTQLYAAFHSQNVPDDRPVWAYLPPSYDENTRARFPVVYFHDGQNLFDPSLAFGGNEWRVDETMDAGAEDGSIREAIAVGVGNTSNRLWEMTPTDGGMGGGGGDRYLKMIAEELKPAVDGMLRTVPDRASTGIFGSSLGGLISAHAGVTRAETFARVGAMSPSTWWDNLFIVGEVSGAKGKMPAPLDVYVDCGTSNDDEMDTVMLAGAYRADGWVDGKSLLYVEQQGGMHNEIYWAERLPAALHFLLGPRSP